MIATNRYVLLLALALAMTTLATSPSDAQSMSMGAGDNGDSMMGNVDISMIPRVPPVAGYADGERIFFIHTEVSDQEISAVMTEMMGSPVPVVPTLADAPETMLAKVWAFTNGIKPDGPRGPLDFQPDVFDHPVGTVGYRPLRELELVTWNEGIEARLLTSAADVAEALRSNEVSIEKTGVVVNAPFLTWPDGQR